MTQPDALRWIFEVEKRDIAYIVGVFEGYDDIAIVRTIDAARGRIELIIAPDYREDARQVVVALKEEIPLREVPAQG
ncbi:MAG: DUF4911 domain-containing protein [Nitrospina sp.]|nr:DUF4911 domain-containing protein [Nitrospina sp.]